MRIAEVTPQEDGSLFVVAEDGRSGVFDVRPYLESPAFRPLAAWEEFKFRKNKNPEKPVPAQGTPRLDTGAKR